MNEGRAISKQIEDEETRGRKRVTCLSSVNLEIREKSQKGPRSNDIYKNNCLWITMSLGSSLLNEIIEERRTGHKENLTI